MSASGSGGSTLTALAGYTTYSTQLPSTITTSAVKLASIKPGCRLGEFLPRLHLLHLHAGGAYADDLAIVDLSEHVNLASRMDLMFAVFLDLLAKQRFPIEVFFLLASVMPEAPMVLADAIIPSAMRRLIMRMLLWVSAGIDCAGANLQEGRR
jgi:hypothetical protein